LDNLLVPLLTGLLGAGVGFLLTRLNDWLAEHRNLALASRHLRTEMANVARRYAFVRARLESYETSPAWINNVHLETCRFYGGGLGTFDTGTLRLFDERTAEDTMYLILMLRNNNAYVDQAKQYLAAEDKATFAEVCRELIGRCSETIEHARLAEANMTARRKGRRLFGSR
jgi:hypothetical protein